MAAGLLWSAGDSPALRLEGDTSLGPAFGRHGRSGSIQNDDGGGLSDDNGYRGRSGGGGGGGSCTISGRPLVYLCAACSSLCSVLLGYDVGVMSGAKEFIRPDLGLSTVQNVSLLRREGGGTLTSPEFSLARVQKTLSMSCRSMSGRASMASIAAPRVVLVLGVVGRRGTRLLALRTSVVGRSIQSMVCRVGLHGTVQGASLPFP